MQIQHILVELDREIERLRQARTVLAGSSNGNHRTAGKRKPGRPKGSGKTNLAARRNIAEAMRLSWARRKGKATATVAKKRRKQS